MIMVAFGLVMLCNFLVVESTAVERLTNLQLRKNTSLHYLDVVVVFSVEIT